MGEVYRASDEVLGRQVAIKLMLPVPQSFAASERFLREARAAARILSPHVVAAYDFGEYGDGYYLAMELVTGDSVAYELKRLGALSPDRAERIVRQVAAGLAAAHQEGIVHRDIKPGNLLLADDGTVKIADFGIARFLHDSTTTLTSAGQVVGTSHYMSPERALGQPAEPASDVYALGCVLYQLVTGHPPFMADEPTSIMYQHVQREPIPPREIRPELAGDLEALVLWMLAKDPAQRPTAAQVAEGVPPPIRAEPALDAVPTRVLPVRRKPVLAGVVAALALAASATLGILLETTGARLPTTNDLSPGGAATLPSVVPSTPRTPPTTRAPTVRPSTRSTSASAHKPSATHSRGKAKAGKGDKPREDAKSGPGKHKKPKR
jgi:eukaryotic-like serine/threonine-protein kinase